MKTIIGACTAAVAFVATPAFADVVISNSVVGTTATYAAPADSTIVIDFNSGDIAAEATAKGLTATTTGLAQSFSGYVFDFNGTGEDFFQPEPTDDSPYFGVASNSSLTLTSASGFTTVNAFLGSLDNYNVVTFLGSNGATLASFTGEQIFGAPLAFPGGSSSDTNRRVTFSATDSTRIFGVVFSNIDGRGAFEFDNVALSGAVPEPATWAMMIAGVGMVGAAARSRRRVATARA